MRQWLFRQFCGTHLRPVQGHEVWLDGVSDSPTEVQVTTGSLTVAFSLIAQAAGSSWTLVGAPDVTINRVPTPPFAPLVHGDVLSAGPISAIAMEVSAAVGALDAQVVETVLKADCSDDTLAVAEDELIERGVSSPFAGELATLVRRGLLVRWQRGFAVEARLDLSSPMTRAWMRRWVRLIAVEPGFQFLRHLELVEASDSRQDELEQAAAEIVAQLERKQLVVLERLELSGGFACIEGSLGRRLATVASQVELTEDAGAMAEDAATEQTAHEEKRFPAPVASSWPFQEGP